MPKLAQERTDPSGVSGRWKDQSPREVPRRQRSKGRLLWRPDVGRPSTHFCSVRLDADPGYLVDLEELEHAHKNVLRVPKLDTSRNLLGEQDEHADPHLVHEGDVGKIEHDFLLADWLSFHPNLEVVGASQSSSPERKNTPGTSRTEMPNVASPSATSAVPFA